MRRLFNSYNRKLFLNFFIVFALFAMAVSLLQFRREKQVRVDQLEAILNNYNGMVFNMLQNDSVDLQNVSKLIPFFPDSNLRVTLIDFNGHVFYDSFVENYQVMENHINRPEIQKALKLGKVGQSIRYSNSTGQDYYYFARRYDNCFVRTALPYNMKVAELLKAETVYLSIIVFIFFLSIVGLIYISDRLGSAISKLEQFAISAGNNEPIDTAIKFPNNQLGAIGNQIVAIYKNLRRTKVALSNEKEKLFNHLHISQEGLAIFSADKREILANDNFIQFANFIADQKIVWSDEIFQLKEFEGINKFVNEELDRPKLKGEKALVRLKKNIDKNSRFFSLQCIIFQDNTFEISISDTTVSEKQNILKRQLTSNISHELKTPVSSIQGYMETLVNNPNLDRAKTQFFIERSYSQALRLTELIRDISLLNKIEESSNTFILEEVNLEELVREVIYDVHLRLEEKNIRTSVLFKKSVKLMGNRSLLYSLFRNLVDNSIAYGGQNLDIVVSCYREDNQYFYFSLYDTGVGVPQQHLMRIFERFYRVDSGRSRKMGGTGLGLAIVKNAITLHQGQITVKTRKEGGLEFLFTLKKHVEA